MEQERHERVESQESHKKVTIQSRESHRRGTGETKKSRNRLTGESQEIYRRSANHRRASRGVFETRLESETRLEESLMLSIRLFEDSSAKETCMTLL